MATVRTSVRVALSENVIHLRTNKSELVREFAQSVPVVAKCCETGVEKAVINSIFSENTVYPR